MGLDLYALSVGNALIYFSYGNAIAYYNYSTEKLIVVIPGTHDYKCDKHIHRFDDCDNVEYMDGYHFYPMIEEAVFAGKEVH